MAAKRARIGFLTIVFILALLVEPAAARAVAEHGSQHGPVPFAQFLLTLLSFWINFLIYSALLFFILRKPFKTNWEERRHAYETNVAAAKNRLNSSKQRLVEAQVRLSAAHIDREKLRETAQKETRFECEQIIAQAKEKTKSIIQSAHELAKAERLGAERQVQAEVAERALALARDELRRELTVEADKPYRQNVLQAVKQLLQ